MHNIAVIGAGQLGSRHLQGLASLGARIHLHIVDPSESACELARSRYMEVCGDRDGGRLRLHRDYSTLPNELSVAVIATTADHRFDALSSLFENSKVQYLLLEKVLFQQFAQFERAGELIEKHGAQTWVNCARRAFPIYQTVKSWFNDDEIIHMEVTGGAWGLGCNGIHFVDLFAFLLGAAPSEYDVCGLDAGVLPARRTGFVEYSGTLRGRLGKISLALTAVRDSSLRHFVIVRSAKQNVVLDESGGVAWRCQNSDQSDFLNFKVPFQSQMTGELVAGILDGRGCPLTPYRDSAALHVPFLRALCAHGGDRNAESCLVT